MAVHFRLAIEFIMRTERARLETGFDTHKELLAAFCAKPSVAADLKQHLKSLEKRERARERDRRKKTEKTTSSSKKVANELSSLLLDARKKVVLYDQCKAETSASGGRIVVRLPAAQFKGPGTPHTAIQKGV